MNRKIKHMGARLLVVAVMLLAISFQSFAASGRIAFSDPSTQVGDEVSVTMKFSTLDGSALGNTDVMLAYDATMLDYINETENASGGAGVIRVWSAPAGSSEAATILRFKALKAGTAKITVSSWEAYDNNGQTINVEKQGSSTITIKGLETSSTDVRLQSLQVSPGTLTPSFSPSVNDYTVTVGLDTDQLTVSAVTNNDKATVSIEGDTGLQEGENTVLCRVVAEDGTSSGTYTITVNKVEGGGTTPEETGGEAAVPEVLAELDVTAKKIRIIALPEGVAVPKGFRESKIAIGDAKVPGWTWAEDASPRYCVFYGVNENGDQNFYRYDLTEKTVQRYFEDLDASSYSDEDYTALAENYNSLLDDYRLFRILAFVFLGAAVLLLIFLLVSRRNSGRQASGRADNFSRDAQKQAPGGSVSRRAGSKKMTKEERYMRGQEEEYQEEEEEAAGDDFIYEDDAIEREALPKRQAAPSPMTVDKEPARTPVIKMLDPSKETAATVNDEDGFEFFDL